MNTSDVVEFKMKVDSLIGTNSKVGSHQRRPATLDRNESSRDGNSVSPVHMKTSTRHPRRRKAMIYSAATCLILSHSSWTGPRGHFEAN